jgi:hypothetical protein
MPASLRPVSFSSAVKALARSTVQNGVVAFRTEARPAPSSVWPMNISEKGMTLLSMARPKNALAIGRAAAKDGPRTAR